MRVLLRQLRTEFDLQPMQVKEIFDKLHSDTLQQCGFTQGVSLRTLNSQYCQIKKDDPKWQRVLAPASTPEEKAEREEAEVDYAAVFGEALAELEKAKQGGAVDFGKVESLYKEKLQPLVQKRDAEFEDTLD